MAYLYQEIMNVPGLTGTAGTRQAQLYERLGSPMGAYKGTYEQNMYLYDQIQKGNYGQAAQPQAQAPTVASTIPAPAQYTPFSEFMGADPFSTGGAWSPLITGLAEQNINPEIQRQFYTANRSLNSDLSGSGAYRTGLANVARQGLADTTERTRKEQVQAFEDYIRGQGSTWYNQQAEAYGKDPSKYIRPIGDTFEDYMANNPSVFQSYQTQTNIPKTYTNPYSY